ncbi:MAG: type III-A CRISPR-associated protein Csm2 [Candidatus Diapherotrites archaeon]
MNNRYNSYTNNTHNRDEIIEKIRNEKLDEAKIDELAQKIVEKINNNKIKYHQLRKIYDYIRKAKDNKDLILAKPKIAYQNRVIKNTNFLDYYLKFIDRVIESNDPKEKEYLKQFNEAIICYFKYYEKQGD